MKVAPCIIDTDIVRVPTAKMEQKLDEKPAFIRDSPASMGSDGKR